MSFGPVIKFLILKFFEKRLNWVFQIKDIGFSFQITEGSYILIDI